MHDTTPEAAPEAAAAQIDAFRRLRPAERVTFALDASGRLLLLSAVVLALSCGRAEDSSSSAGAQVSTAADSLPALPSVTRAQRYESLTLDEAVRALAEVEGRFVLQRPGVGYEFDGDRSLFIRLRRSQEEAAEKLIDCFTDTTAAVATVAGRRVSVGAMCAYALGFFAYYEHTDEEGDSSGDWDGYVDVTADAAALRRAQAAWRKLQPRGYILLPP